MRILSTLLVLPLVVLNTPRDLRTRTCVKFSGSPRVGIECVVERVGEAVTSPSEQAGRTDKQQK